MKIKGALKTIIILVLIISIAILVRVFLFEVYIIPSESMKNTLLSGDVVLMNKLKYGVRKKDSSIDKRLLRFDKPQRGDIMIFNFPLGDTVMSRFPTESYYEIIRKNGRKKVLNNPEVFGKALTYSIDERVVYIKRCVAMPGDVFQVLDGKVLLNRSIDIKMYDSIRNAYKIDSSAVDRIVHQNTDRDEFVYPQDNNYRWNPSFYGPVYIPKKGDTIKLDKRSYALYRRIIKAYEFNQLYIKKGVVFLNNQPSKIYVFKQNYYFVVGDNFYESKDSRYWGFLPEDHIIGKATLVLFSFRHWNRFFKAL